MLGVQRLGIALLIGTTLACEGASQSSHSDLPTDGARAAGGSNAGSPTTSSGASGLGMASGGSDSRTSGGGTSGAGVSDDESVSEGGMTESMPGGSDAGGGSEASSIPIEQVSEALARAHCAIEQRCTQAIPIDGLVMPGEDCVLRTKKRLELNGLELLAAAVSAGRIAYHPELMPACQAAITDRECQDTIERDLPACEAAITGSAALGEPCQLSEECQGSLICETRLGCPGTCVDRYAEGVRCSVDAECANGLGCDSYSGSCRKAVNVDEACEGEGNLTCLPGLFCAKKLADLYLHRPPGTCAPISRARAGATSACDPLRGRLCGADPLHGSETCVLEALAEDSATWACHDLGQACGLALPEPCPSGQYCPIDNEAIARGELTATCIALPMPGAACARRPVLGVLLRSCAPYARCDSGGTCNELGEVGAFCDDDDQCYTGYCSGSECARAHACP